MKQPSFFIKFLFIGFALIINPTITFSVIAPVQNVETIQSMSKKEMEKKLGRKMKLKERIAFSILKKKQKKAKWKEEKKNGNASGIFAIIFGAMGFIPRLGVLFSLASIFIGLKSLKKAKRNNYFCTTTLPKILPLEVNQYIPFPKSEASNCIFSFN